MLSLLAFLQQALMAWRPEAMFLTQIIICPTGVGVEQVVAVVVVAVVVAAAAELKIDPLHRGVGWGVREMVAVAAAVVVAVVAAAVAVVVAAAAVAVVVVMEGVGLSDSSLSITGRAAP